MVSASTLQFSDPPSLYGLSETVKGLIRLLRDASNLTLDIHNEFFESKIKSIKKHRVKFHVVATETIFHCNDLVKFGDDLITITECSSDETISNEDILDCLNL